VARKLETKGYCHIACEIRAISERAVLVHDGARAAWLPKSQIEDPVDLTREHLGQAVEILLPEWLAKDKGLL